MIFVEMQDYRQFFKRKLYADTFKECYEKHRGLVADIAEACEKADDQEKAVETLAGAIPDYAHGQIESVKSKNKKEGLQIPPKGKHVFGSVNVGERGQIVIPKKGEGLFQY